MFEVKPDAKIAREEIFAVLSVIVFDDVDEAVRIANDTEYGLAAAVWTSNLTTAHDVSRRLRAGTVCELLRRGRRHELPVRRLQAVGQRPRQVAAREKYELKSTLIRLR